MRSTHDGALDIPGLPPRARYAHVIPGIRHSLLSIVRLCNAGCEVIFGRWGLNVEVWYKGKIVMKAKKSTVNGLWYVPITSTNKEDNLEQSNNSEVNPDQQGQEAATQATQHQMKFQTVDTQELTTRTQQQHAKINQMREQMQIEAQN